MGHSVLALTVAAAAISFGTLDPGAIVRAQAQPLALGELELARWGLLIQPVGFALSLVALARLPGPAKILGAHGVGAAMIATVYLGGWTLPLPLELDHGPMLVTELLTIAAKIALVSVVVTRLSVRKDARTERSRADRSSLRWDALLGLALLNLAASLAWIAV
jgi:NADH:ubiquinone oxidoreductase subunit H